MLIIQGGELLNTTPQRFELSRWELDFQANTRRVEALGSSNSSTATSETWSPAQCVEHLNITALTFLPLWRQVSELPNAKPGADYAFWWRWFSESVKNPKKARSRTSAKFEPNPSLSLPDVRSTYLEQRQRVLNLARQIAASDKCGWPVQSPFAGWMKYPAGFSFDLWLAHECRHLTQAERTLLNA